MTQEKEQVESVLVELLGFSENCDNRFDKMTEEIKLFQTNCHDRSQKVSDLLTSLEGILRSHLKDLMIAVDDHDLRDDLLSLLAFDPAA